MTEQQKSKLQRRALTIGCASLVVLLGVVACTIWIDTHYFLPKRAAADRIKLETIINSEAPEGCSRKQIEAWCDRISVNHFYSGSAEAGGVVVHLFRPALGITTADEIVIFFKIDEHGLCVGHTTEFKIYGL